MGKNRKSASSPTESSSHPPTASSSQKSKEKENENEKDWKNDKSYPSLGNVLREIIPAVIIGLFLYYAYPQLKARMKAEKQQQQKSSSSQVGNSQLRIFTAEELSVYNGIQQPQLYIAYLGEVFDVSAGDKHYGKDGGYHFFTGKDASRAFVTGQFNEEGLVEGVDDFDLEQIGGLMSWYTFYKNHDEYRRVGKLVGTFWTSEGKQTKALQKVKRRFNDYQDWVKEQEVMKKKYPDCNMQSWENKDAEVWCDSGLPRRIRFGLDKGVDRARCACYSEAEILQGEPKDSMLYPNCETLSRKCRYVIKDMEQRIINAYPDSAEAQQMLGLRKKTLPAPVL
jgi:predicted heme/steroid binding protein